MSDNSAVKKSRKAQQARSQRCHIKFILRTALRGIEDVPESKGTDFLITTLANHVLKWKAAYYNNSLTTTTVADQVKEAELHREEEKEEVCQDDEMNKKLNAVFRDLFPKCSEDYYIKIFSKSGRHHRQQNHHPYSASDRYLPRKQTEYIYFNQ